MAVVWRHRNKLVLLAAMFGGGYVAVNAIKKRIQGFQDKNMTIRLESIRFNEHFHGNYNTAVSAVLDLLPSLREALQSELNAEAITKELRLKPPNKRDLWDNLKIISFTRLVGGAYAYVLLSVFMRIQLSILGGRMFSDMNKGAVNVEVQKQYLSTVQHLLREGLHSLIMTVRGSCEVILSQYSLKQHLSCDGILQIIQDIRNQVTTPFPAHASLSHRRSQHFVLQYAMPKETLLQHQVELETDELRVKTLLLMGTRDILENTEVGCVVEECIIEIFKQAALQITESFLTVSQGSDVLPMPRVVPLICDISLLLFNTQSNPLQNLLSSQDLQTLSRNIYEAFANDTV